MTPTGSDRLSTARRASLCVLVALLLVVLGAGAPAALADGDPGSDVLVNQSLFVASDAAVSIQQQAELGALLSSAQDHGVPIRVAIIASRSDLGAVTGLWLKPRAYARFLGFELSLAYHGRLLVVMPNGFGFNWPGHPTSVTYELLDRTSIGSGGEALATAAGAAVRTLAAADGVRLAVPSSPASGPEGSPGSAVKTAARPASGSTVESEVAVIVLAALAATGLVLLARRGLARRQRRPLRFRVLLRRPRAGSVLAAGGTAAVALVVASVVIGSPSAAQSQALLTNPNLDPGTNVSRTAPGFTLTDQFGQPVSLRSFRGKVVLLAFTDSECTTICPLTTNAMLEAKRMLGAAGKQVELLGIDANPKSTALQDVLSYSQLHGLLHDWHFLTGSLPQLEQVWKAYGIQAAIRAGEITHTPALYVIDPRGRLVKLYLTQPSYAAIDQQGQVLAQEASRLLPDHPVVRARYGYTEIRGITPSAKVTLPRFSGGSVRLGPGSAHLYLFFATWDREITSLAGQLEALDGYNRDVAASRLPALTAIDEGSIEPSASALGQFIKTLPRPLTYPLAIDSSGRVADGYEVQGEPWFVLTSPSGRIVWYWQVSTSGWLGTRALKAHVRAALASVPKAPAGTVAVQQALTGSPPPLAALHQQSSRLIGNGSGLLDRVKALRGFPIVINAWASWCTPCQEEFGLFATASAQYGRQVAFLGADTADSSGSAEAFLAKHKVSYPSYPTSMSGLDPLVPQGLAGLPTTIFLNRAGKLAYVHIGQYQSEGALYADIREYAIGS